MNKPNVFLVHTEYHLMLAINIVFELYKDRKNYIYVTKSRIKREFTSEHDFLEYKYLPGKDYGTKSLVKSLLKLDLGHFFYFQEDCSDNIYLTYFLYKNKIPVSLVQDGTKPYHSYHKKHLFLSRVRDTMMIYKEMIRRKSVVPTVLLANYYAYANTKYVTDVWLTCPDKYINASNKTIMKIPDFNAESIMELNSLYGFDESMLDTNAILFIGTPFQFDNDCKMELNIIQDLKAIFANSKVVYKAHPNTSKDMLDKIKAIDGVELFLEKIPAELLILSMKNTIIIGSCSTSMLTYNKTCRYYWTHKKFTNSREFTTIHIGNPTNYIKEITSVDEIV